MMPRRRSPDRRLSLPPSRTSPRTSLSALKSNLESRGAQDQPFSWHSSGSSLLSSPPGSADFSDPFGIETVSSGREDLKRKIDHVDTPGYEGPVTRAAAKEQTSDKKRKVHFHTEDAPPKSKRPRVHDSQNFCLLALDAPFRLTKRSILAQRKGSKSQKAWSRKYFSTERQRVEAIKLKRAENLKSALGPDPGGSRASTPASFASNTPTKRGRGNGRRGRGRGGRGGRGRGGGRPGRNEDSPEPPTKKNITEAEKEILADLKARQIELKKLFKEVGAQQIETLDLLAMRDLNKIAKKSRTQTKVPEYEEVLDALDRRKRDAEAFAKGRQEYESQQAKILLDAGKEVIERRYETRCVQAKSEHYAGAQADYFTAREAIQAIIDANRTEPGSPDPTRFPRLHPFAEPGMIRGYYSQRITDETFLRRPPSSFDDAIRHEVVDHDLIYSALSKSLDLPSPRSVEDTSRHARQSSSAASPSIDDGIGNPTLSIQTLADEAARRLQEGIEPRSPIDQASHLRPPPAPPFPPDVGLGSWPLSRLADAAESESSRRQLLQNNHLFEPTAVPRNLFEPWFPFTPQRQPQPPPPPQSMWPVQWPPQMQSVPTPMPMPPPMPPSLPQSVFSSGRTTPHPPALPPQLAQYHPQQQQQHQPPMSAQFHESFHQQPQHPPPLPYARPLYSEIHPQPPKHPQDTKYPLLTLQPQHQHHQHPQHQPHQLIQPPLTFIEKPIPTALATTTSATTAVPELSQGRKHFAPPFAYHNSQPSHVGRGPPLAVAAAAAAAPPKGGQRLLLPKSS